MQRRNYKIRRQIHPKELASIVLEKEPRRLKILRATDLTIRFSQISSYRYVNVGMIGKYSLEYYCSSHVLNIV
jgi:hypothetical protein